jgi:uncharacterized protein
MEGYSGYSWAVVTGASSGMGADFARELSLKGYNLILTARREKELLSLRDEIKTNRAECEIIVLPGDLTSKDFREKLLETTGRLPVTVLINNAGVGAYGKFDAISEATEEDMLDLDIKALVHLTRAISVQMKKLKTGYILQLASIAAFQPTPFFASYGAAKAFVMHYGLAVRKELSGSGVSVTVLCPGVTATAFFDTANQKELTTFQKITMMQSEKVVNGALRALFSGKPIFVPGVINRFNSVLTRFISRTAASSLAARFASK